MKTNLFLITLGAFFSTLTIADDTRATWGVAELLEAQKASVEHFKNALGENLSQQISGLTVDLNSQKNAANAKLRYMDGSTAKEVSYFCHTHGSEIDCH